MRASVPAILIAACLVAACQGAQQPPQQRTGEGMIDPATGALLPEFNDGSFSMSLLLEERLNAPLSNSTRREIDNATDTALSLAPSGPGVGWSNPVHRHEGMIDVAAWRIDQRAGELCGTIEHESTLDKVHSGVVTICRASIDPAWRIDEVVWDKPKRVVSTGSVTGGSGASTGGDDGGSSGSDGVAGAGVNYGVGNKSSSGTDDPAAATDRDCQPKKGGGAMTLGDCLAQPRTN